MDPQLEMTKNVESEKTEINRKTLKTLPLTIEGSTHSLMNLVFVLSKHYVFSK
jgi:DNA-directed RNA polymerase subunit L